MKTMKILKLMIKEEWRFHSSVYKGGHLATLPLLIFVVFLGGFYLLENYSTDPLNQIELILAAFGLFMGLGAGTAGFSSHDAIKNVLGDRSMILFSHTVLPIRSSVLIVIFLIKDLIFYLFLYMMPIIVSLSLINPLHYTALSYLLGTFLAGLVASLIVALVGFKFSMRSNFLDYARSARSPLTRKSLIDIFRSSGGFLKVLVSFGVLMGFYWYVVVHVPAASTFLANPLLSFSVMFGLMSITLYNWVNTYDKFEDYSFLPMTEKQMVKQKFNAFLQVMLIIIPILIGIPYIFFGGDLILAISLSFASSYFGGAAASYFTGLNPNKKLMQGKTFLKLVLGVNVFLLPLMILTIFDLPQIYILINVIVVLGVGRLFQTRAADRIEVEEWGL